MPDNRRITLVVHGRVQGVFYRDSTRRKAQDLGLTGTVRNLPEGTVGIVAEGPPGGLEELIQWAWQGPPASRVSRVDVAWEAWTGEFQGFTIRY